MGRRAGKAEVEARTARAAELIAQHVGQRPYGIIGAIAAEFGIRRRQGATYYTRACEALAGEHADTLRLAGHALPAAFADAIARARQAGNLRAELKALELLNDLGRAVAAGQDHAPVTGIDLVIVDGDRQCEAAG